MGVFEKIFFVPHPPAVLPEVGKGRELYLNRTMLAYQRFARTISLVQPENIIFVSPHGVAEQKSIIVNTASQIQDNFARYDAEQLQELCFLNTEIAHSLLLRSIGQRLKVKGEEIQTIDHGTFIPLHFIHKYYQLFLGVNILIPPQISDEDLLYTGQLLRHVVQETGQRTVLVISGDLSHRLSPSGPYGYSPRGLAFDQYIRHIFSSGDIQLLGAIDNAWRQEAAQCAMGPLLFMTGAIGQPTAQTSIYSHEYPFGIGYMLAEIEEI